MVGVKLAALPVYSALAAFGQRVLVLGFVAWLLVETYRLVTKGQCDYFTPLARFAAGSVLLQALPKIHDEVAGALFEAGQKIGAQNTEQLFLRAYEHAIGGSIAAQQGAGVLDAVSMLANVFSLQGMFALGSVGLALSMQVLKVLILHVLWPLCLGLVVAYGALAIPLGALPGMSTLKGWLKNLVEVAIWPLVFQTVVSLLVGSFDRTLTAVAQLDFARVFTDPTAPARDIMTLVEWWAICWAYLLLCLLTPLLASMVVRSTPVGIIGGIVAAQAVRLASAGVGQLAGAGLGRFVAGAAGRMMGGAAGGLGQAGLATATVATSAVAHGPPQTAGTRAGSALDARTHRSPPPSGAGRAKGEPR